MPLEKIKNITKTRKELSQNFDTPGLHPVTVKGRLAGVIISIGEVDENTSQRLAKRLKANQKAGVDELFEMAMKPETE